jgi:hypothetical protein
VKLHVEANGATVDFTNYEFTSYPSVTGPTANGIWSIPCEHTVTWTPVAPLSNVTYLLGAIDPADPNAQLTWPGQGNPINIPGDTTSYPVPFANFSAGDWLLVIGATRTFPIPGADEQSGFIIGAFDAVPIHVVSDPVLVSLEVTPRTAGIPVGGLQPFAAKGTYCTTEWDYVTASVTWASSDAGVATVGNGGDSAGLAAGESGGVTTVSASSDSLSDSAAVTVLGTLRSSGTASALNAVVWTGTQFVAVGDSGAVVTSPDGVTWTPRTSGTSSQLRAVAWSGALLVAVGDGGDVRTSPNGVTWTARASGTTGDLNGLTWSGSQFVAVGYAGATVASPTGTSWTPMDAGVDHTLRAVTWSGSQFVAVGDAANPSGVGYYFTTVLSSPDGVTWTRQSDTGNGLNTLTAVSWSGSEFVALGFNDAVLTSPDGVTWTSRDPGLANGVSLYGGAWDGTQFEAAGTGGVLTRSPDGVMWTPALTSGWELISGQTNDLLGVASSGGRLVVVGSSGTIVSMP